MRPAAKVRKIPRGFFIAVHPIAMALVLQGVYLLMMAWVWPNGVSTKMFGDISNLIFYLGDNYNDYMKIAFLCTMSSHVIGSVVSLMLCFKLKLRKGVTALWFFQTLVFGFPSLQYLLWPQNAIINLYSD